MIGNGERQLSSPGAEHGDGYRVSTTSFHALTALMVGKVISRGPPTTLFPPLAVAA